MSSQSLASRVNSIGNYKLQKFQLGKGSFARVELATHVILNRFFSHFRFDFPHFSSCYLAASFCRKVALKITVKSDLKEGYVQRNLHREAEILSRVSGQSTISGHANVLRLLEIIDCGSLYCLVLEYIDGGTLYEHLQGRGMATNVVCKAI
jgi:serine/threonine protein kinase